MFRCVVALVSVSVVLLAAACGNGGSLFDITPLSDFLDVQVNNNTSRAVTIADCYGTNCERGVGFSFRDRLAPGTGRGEAAWNNSTGGLAEIRVMSGTRTIGCFKIRFGKGQQHATVNVSAAAPCSAPPKVS